MRSRREVIRGTLALGATAFVAGQDIPGFGSNPKQDDEPEDLDRKAVMEAGMTDAEADCWKKTANCAGAFFNLPELHPMDQEEVANAIHIIQNKLLSRPTYRAYLAKAKELRGIDD